jgi:hypothetical protein
MALEEAKTLAAAIESNLIAATKKSDPDVGNAERVALALTVFAAWLLPTSRQANRTSP